MSKNVMSAEESELFRARCRDFLSMHAIGSSPFSIEDARAFLAASSEAGLAGIPYAVEYGGAGLTTAHDKIWREERAAFPQVDRMFIISHGMCLPMINEYGSEDQKRAFQADMIAGRTLWCQMFSEPGAGSDVASLQASAIRDGDEWILNGQKIWTTFAHLSDYGLIVLRTDVNLSKHAGISMFILDMRLPGVEIRPIKQIDGGRNFNEVFLTDVRIPATRLVGNLNEGWRLATSMLMYERVAIGSGGTDQVVQPIFDHLVDIATANGTIGKPLVRDQITRMYILETCKSLVALRTRAELKAGKTPGPGGSLGKLLGSKISRQFRNIAQNIAGPSSTAWDENEATRGQLQLEVLASFQNGIAGGTDEIQRNIIGERVLGLPREPALDRDTPFRELRVNT